MKKFRLRLLMVIICFILMLWLLPNTSVQAESEEFTNIDLVTVPKISDPNKVLCTITWETSQKIIYLKVTITLQNKKEQIFTYSEGLSENIKFSSVKQETSKEKIYYLNKLQFDLYNHQSGNMNVKFDYSYVPILQGEETHSCNCFFITGSWVKKQPIGNAIITGIVITVCCGIATYVIIENSHRNIWPNSIDEEEEEYHDE